MDSYIFKTSLWTHPFINLECPSHEMAKNKGYFAKSTSSAVSTTWWNGEASHTDFTNPEAATWWSNALYNLLAKSEFLLDEKILEAPVIVEGAKSRDVYLPSEIWRDEYHPSGFTPH